MKTYTFKLNNNTNTSTFSNNFYKSTNYSKILDDLILDDIIAKNSWLNIKKKADDILIDNLIKESKKYEYNFDDDTFAKAAAFLAGFSAPKLTIPFKKDKTYELSDGTIITITDDYIHINDKMYFFNLFGDFSFLKALTPKEKKTICTIYTDSLKITIKK